MDMDNAFSAVCQLFSKPSAVERQQDKAQASSIAASKAAVLQQAKLQASCQAYLLLSALVQQGLRWVGVHHGFWIEPNVVLL